MRFPFACVSHASSHAFHNSVRSSSAKAPSTVKAILHAGVEVSICSEKETKSIPNALNVSKLGASEKRSGRTCRTDRRRQSQTASCTHPPRTPRFRPT